jgi:UDP-N-acetylglucosamine 2-epimerase (non-hydrolysing)
MRDNTERPITVEVGSNVLAGTCPDKVKRTIDQVMSGDIQPGVVPDLWDGQAAERIVDIIEATLGVGRAAAPA